MDLIDIKITLHPTTTKYTFFSNIQGTFSRMDHLLGHKTLLNKFKKIEIIPNIFSNQNGMKLEINNKTGKFTNMLKLNNTLLNNPWGKTYTHTQEKLENIFRQMRVKTERTKNYEMQQKQYQEGNV